MIPKDHAFTSERLTYRGINLDDTDEIVAWRSDPGNYRFFFSNRPTTREGHLTWFENYLADDARFDFMIFDASGKKVGVVWISEIQGDTCEVSYLIGDTASRGFGYAVEAIRAICAMAKGEFGIVHFNARILPENIASQKTAEKAGFVERERVYTYTLAG